MAINQRFRLLAWLVFSVLAGLGPPTIASAHSSIVSSEPAPGQQLNTAPGSVELRFTEPINTRLSRARVIAPTGQRSQGMAVRSQGILVQVPTTVPGIYGVTWTTVSTIDGHALSGSFRFGVGVAPAGETEGNLSLAPQPLDLLVALARALEYVGLFAAVGTLLLRYLAGRGIRLIWVQRSLRAPLAIALFGGVAVVIGEAMSAAAAPSTEAVADYLRNGTPGLARLARIVAESLALVAAGLGPYAPIAPLALAIAALAAAGHAAATSPAGLGVGVDALHLLSAAIWAGGILALAALRPSGGWLGPDARMLLNRFSPVAVGAFLVTVGTGTVRGTQELGELGDLVASSYGQVLSAKVILVVAMVPLSVLAWRRRLVAPRAEAVLVLAVVAAAGLLAAFPLPPSRAREAEAAVEAGPFELALPQAGDLTLGGDAGEVLVGLTLRPGIPGRNTVLVYVDPPEGASAASGLPVTLSVAGQPQELATCGASCRSAELSLAGGERLDVNVGGPKGGRARFDIPALPTSEGNDTLQRLQVRMHGLHTYRLEEVLRPAEPPIRAQYDFQAPDRMHYQLGDGSQLTWIGEERYLKETQAAPWQREQTGFSIPVPGFTWDPPTSNAELGMPRRLGAEQVDGADTQVVSLFMHSGSLPVWFRLWVDADGLVHRAQMRAPGHFMEHRYYDFDAPFAIEAPAGYSSEPGH